MSEKEKKFFSIEGKLVEVSEEIYYEYYRPIWRERKRSQSSGRCVCPGAELWKCDGVCQGCEYYATGNQTSLDVELDGQDGVTLGDVLPDLGLAPNELVEKRELYTALHKALSQLTPLQKSICEYIMVGKTEREIAKLISKPQSTVNYQKNKALDQLRKVLKNFL